MSKNPSFVTYVGLSLLLGLWLVMLAHYGSKLLYHPGEIEEHAYPLIAAEEAAPEEQPAEAVEAEPAAEEAAEAEPAAEEAVEAEPAAEEAAAPAVGEGIAALLASADADAGAKVSKKCAACHSFDKGGKNKVGPNLWDIVGKAMASTEGFKYSSGLAGMGGEWSYDNLDTFLTKPKDFVAGTKMSFAGIKDAEDRANLIAFLRGLSDEPKPLP